jgi:hypothetical protein
MKRTTLLMAHVGKALEESRVICNDVSISFFSTTTITPLVEFWLTDQTLHR